MAARTVSGTGFTVLFVGLAVALVVFILVAAPRLQDRVAELLGDEKQVLHIGQLGATEWIVSAVTGEAATCLVTELDGERAAETCLDPGAGRLGPVAVADAEGAGYVLTGITAPDVPQVRVELDDGQIRLPRVFRPRGYPAGFYATTVGPGVAVERVVGLDLDERELAVRACDGGPLATGEGAVTACAVGAGSHSGGQG